MGLFDFFGKDALKANQRAAADAQHMQDVAQKKSIDTREDYLDRSMAELSPWRESGERALGLYDDYLGTSGPNARQSFFDNLQFGPEFDAAQEYGVRALDRSAAARGSLFSGGQMEDLHDFGMTNFGNFLQPYLNRLQGQQGQGFQAANIGAGLLSNTGGQIADTQFGGGQLSANRRTALGNAEAAQKGVGLNNLLNIASVASQFVPGASGPGGGGPQKSPWGTTYQNFNNPYG